MSFSYLSKARESRWPFSFLLARQIKSTAPKWHTRPAPDRRQAFLPAAFDTPSVRNTSKVVGWPKGKMPTPAPGFEVSLFAENLDNPRQAMFCPMAIF
jgi:hypothetical protein